MDAADADVVAVLTRAPSAGGKSRLFAALARPCDRSLLEALLLDTLDGAVVEGVRLAIAVTPASALDEIAALTPHTPVVAQSDGSLGDRMSGVMRALFTMGARRVALIGSDLPEITPGHIAAAFSMLRADRHAVVLGPALDGGYYLIAAGDVPPVFDGIDWGTARVLEQTVAAAARSGRTVQLLPPLGDVDAVSDLRRLEHSASGSRSAAWVRNNLVE